MKHWYSYAALLVAFLVVPGCAEQRERFARHPDGERRREAPRAEFALAEPTSCFMGEPQSSAFADVVRIEREGYLVGFSRETHTPIWSCYRLFDVDNDAPPRPNKKFDTYSDGVITVTHEDYTNSGYDRGHLAPSSGIGKCYGVAAQKGTFTTTNICPQHPGLNQRCWERFESEESDWYADKFGEIWVVTGPIYSDSCIELMTDVRVPEAFFKVVVAKIDGDWSMLGIIMTNERTNEAPISDFVHSVDEIEELAGIDLFAELPDDVENTLEANRDPSPEWNVGWVLRPVYPGGARPIQIRECD